MDLFQEVKKILKALTWGVSAEGLGRGLSVWRRQSSGFPAISSPGTTLRLCLSID